MKKYIILAALLTSATAFSQTQDSLLRRQMELERDFNPTLLDANKITSLPTLREPVVQRANTNYSAWAGRTTPSLEIALPRPGTIMTEIPFNTKRGYISLSAGNYANIDGALGYRLIDNERNSLSFNFLHTSTNGDVKYVQDSTPKSNKAFAMDNVGQLSYGHLFSSFKLDLRAAYQHSLFNYYGNTFGSTRVFDNENQRLGVFSTRVGVESVKSDLLNYRGYVDFRNFGTKFGERPTADGIKGNQIDAVVGLDKPFGGGGTKVGIDGRFFTTLYGSNFSDYAMISAAPYIRFEGFNWHAKLGADVQFQLTSGRKIRVIPNVQLHWSVTEHSSLYADVRGGLAHNTFLSVMDESRYIHPTEAARVKPSFSIVDVELGAKIGEVSGFRFDIFGGYKKTDDEHFLVLQNYYVDDMPTTGIWAGWVTNEILMPVYGNLSHSHIGGMIQSNIWSPLDISVRLKKNFYTVKDLTIHNVPISDVKAYNKPGFETDIRATLSVMSNLKFTLNYYFAGDRWSYFEGANVKMNNINDLNLGAVYDINDSFAINLKANNPLSQKYDIWYGHPAQGFNAMGGFTFKF